MARLILSLENILLTYGGRPLFDGLTMHLNEDDKICLVGKNGAGKTTLMKLMVQDLELDGGKRFLYPGTSIGYLPQKVEHDPEATVLEYVLSGLPKEERNDENHYRAEMVIAPLGLTPELKMQPLSGGQKRRAALAKALVTDPDILLLDEPTNHMDLTAIEWLEGYLQGYRGALVCVSHDRTFLANISRRVFWLDRGQIRVCPFGYGQFEDWLEDVLEQEARELQNLKKKVSAEHDWTQGGVTGRRKRNMRRLRELHRLRDKLRSDKAAYTQRRQKIEMDALETPNASKVLAEFKGIDKNFIRPDGTKLTILKDFHHLVLKGDRIGILGKNGSGKSTFVKLLAGEMEPDKGFIFRSKTMELSYFDQNRTLLEEDKTVQDILCPQGGNFITLGAGDEQRNIHVRGYLKQFLFDPTIINHKVGTLSGGQQNRLLLARILANPGNVMILDEPTNDLDMDTLDMLQEMLAEYQGTLIIVSHDRDFLDRTVTEIIAFEGDGEVHSVIGGYTDYIREKNSRSARSNIAEIPQATPKGSTAAIAEVKTIKKLTYGEKLELEKLPEKIAEIQTKLDGLQAHLDESGIPPEKLTKLLVEFDHTQRILEAAEQRWLELAERN